MAKIALALGFGVLGALTGGLGWAAGIGFAAGSASALTGGPLSADYEGLVFGPKGEERCHSIRT